MGHVASFTRGKANEQENLERMAELTGTEKKEEETDAELRGRINKQIIERGAAPWKKE